MAIVYKATNIINNKKYIGITKRTLTDRKREHEYSAKTEKKISLFHKALLKYGSNNFNWEVIEECEDDNMEDREKFFIEHFNSYAINKNGYNLTKGGLYNFGASGEYHYLNMMSIEEKEKWIEKNMTGENNGMFNNGKIVSGENHFSKLLTEEERKIWLNNISGDNNYQKKLTKKELKEKCWINKLTKEEKNEYANKFLKGENNPFYKNTKKYIITFPNGNEYIIKIMEFCKKYTEIKLHSAGLYSVARNIYPEYKKFKCRLYNIETDIDIKEWKYK